MTDLEQQLAGLGLRRRAVLDRDLLTCPEDDIRDARALATYLNGRPIFEDELTAPIANGEAPTAVSFWVSLPQIEGAAMLPDGARPLKDMRPRQFVSYSYLISGVTYHTAQDITGLESQVRLERLVAGQPASIKYDAANPSDSILVADDWSGLR